MKARTKQRVAEVLAAPYARVLRRDADGGFGAEALEFPGCYSAGADGPEALANLDEAMALWVASQLEQGQEIPPPLAVAEYSGRVTLRLPPSLHERAALLAVAEGVSLNRWLSAAVAVYAGERVDVGRAREVARVAEGEAGYGSGRGE